MSGERPPEPEQQVHTAFGEVSAATFRACHPMRPAEAVSRQNLADYYHILKPDTDTQRRTSVQHAWYRTELGTAINDANVVDGAAPFFRAAMRDTSAPPIARLEAATALASLPAFHDRVAHGAVRADTATRVYSNLVTVLRHASAEPDQNSREMDSLKAKLCVGIMGAYRSGTTKDSRQFLYPTSPREQQGRGDSQTYGHSHYSLGGGDPPKKLPVDAWPDTKRVEGARQTQQPASKGVVRVSLSAMIGEALAADPDLYPDRQDLRNMTGTKREIARARLDFFTERCLANDTALIGAVSGRITRYAYAKRQQSQRKATEADSARAAPGSDATAGTGETADQQGKTAQTPDKADAETAQDDPGASADGAGKSESSQAPAEGVAGTMGAVAIALGSVLHNLGEVQTVIPSDALDSAMNILGPQLVGSRHEQAIMGALALARQRLSEVGGAADAFAAVRQSLHEYAQIVGIEIQG